MTRQIALYTRVSTARCQTVENQSIALHTWAENEGYPVHREYTDEGISGAKNRDQRPGLDAMLDDAEMGYFDAIAVTAYDRLGRDAPRQMLMVDDLTRRLGITLFVNGVEKHLSRSDDELAFHFEAIIAHNARRKISERTMLGLERARRKGVRLGRPPLSEHATQRIETHLRAGTRISIIARLVGVSRPTVYKIRNTLQCSP